MSFSAKNGYLGLGTIRPKLLTRWGKKTERRRLTIVMKPMSKDDEYGPTLLREPHIVHVHDIQDHDSQKNESMRMVHCFPKPKAEEWIVYNAKIINIEIPL